MSTAIDTSTPDTGLGGTRKVIVDALRRRVIDDATGVSEPAVQRYIGSVPDSRFWLGTLTPEAEVNVPGRSRESVERFTPAAQGFSFRVGALPIQMEITVSFALWLTLHPTLAEQRARVGLDDDEDGQDPTTLQAGHAAPDRGVQLARPRMKVPVGDVRFGITLDGPGERTFGTGVFDEAIKEALARLPSGALPYRPRRRTGSLPRSADMADDSAWAAWERENLSDPALPMWRAAVDVELRETGQGTVEVLAMIVNRTPDREHQYTDRDRTQVFPRGACDPKLYEVRLTCTPSTAIIPYALEQIPDSYRYDRNVPALGMNSAVEMEGGALHSAFAATAETERVHPRTQAPDGTHIDTTFATLKSDPLLALDHLVNEARAWTSDHWGDAALDRMAGGNGWLEETRQHAACDARQVREEIEWVQAGIALLRQDPRLLEAFRLMNETMEAVAADRYDAWYPFQLAYILGCLVGVQNPAAAPNVDILWFSTGGGKTEAYLGLNLVHLFYGRLTGRTAGAQTWARFPLRLLSLQQTQRVADSVLLAELVRRRHPRLRDGEPFAVGYYVGSGNTPNSISLPGSRFYNGWDPFDRTNAESCRVLEVCPACQHPEMVPVVEFDRDRYTMVHKCPNPACELHGDRLPVYVVDDDIHRWAPSVIVGTVDKLAQLGQQSKFRVLLGKALSRCPMHGYSSDPDRCAVFGCQESLQPVPAGFGGINFEIQDELHLLSESLGALDGNYETLFQALSEETGTPAVRIMGATATIEGYQEQSRHLYMREARRFPIPGPTKAESFWAVERPGDPLRSYVAMLPRGTTMLNAAFYVTQSHWRFFEEALYDPASFCTGVLDIPETYAGQVEGELWDLYEVMVVYALQKQHLERYAKDVAEDPQICPSEANYDSVTGDVEFWNIRGVLNRLEHPPQNLGQRVRVLGATSAISHGVDVNRLNVMTVMGMPQQTSEFIQATARVGRRHPAVVFALINPMRERDVSHFRYFRKYAEYLDRLVEPVPVNRESLPVLKQVLPGGLAALLLQVDEPQWLYPGGRVPRPRRDRLYYVKGVARAIDEGFIDQATLTQRLLHAFGIDAQDPRFSDHREAVSRFVSVNLNKFLLRRGSGNATKDEMEPPPPRSLRDVETLIEIRGER